ncbi:MAG: PAS domain-containing protein, partial [Candidatus Binatia bacterium]
GIPLHEANGGFTGYVGSCLDITERKQAEEGLRQSQVHLQLTTEAAQMGTWQWNLETNEVFWSAIHKKLWGYEPTPDPIRDEDWASRVHKDDLQRAEESIDKCRGGTAEYEVEYRTYRRAVPRPVGSGLREAPTSTKQAKPL